MSKKVAVVILNWNGQSFLKKFLPSVIQYSSEANVIIADNASSDSSVNFLKKEFPEVRIIQLDKNYGFAGGYNKALKKVNEKYIVLLNSDVEVTEKWLSPLINLMDADENIAACQPKIKDYHHKKKFEYAGAAGGFIDYLGYPFCQGRIFDCLEDDYGQYDEEKEVFWASGAAMLVKNSVFKHSGGLDEFFFAHMEEIDLCWRLKNKGFKIMYCPQSTVYHVGGGTLNKISPKKTFLNYRNSLLMLHKNLPNNKRFKIIAIRLILDGISGIKLLFEGKFKHTLAIIKAHLSFYNAIPQNKIKRKGKQVDIPTGMLTKSVVYHHFIKNVKYYNDFVK